MAKKSKRKQPPATKKSSRSASGFPPVLAGIIGFLLGSGLTFTVMHESPAQLRAENNPHAGHDHGPGGHGSEHGTGAPLSPEALEAEANAKANEMARNFKRSLEAQMNQLDQDLQQNPDRITAEDEESRFVYRHKGSDRWLIMMGRARPDENDRWTAAIVHKGTDRLTGKEPPEGLNVEAVYELPSAHSMEHAVFSETGSSVMLLTRSDNRGQPPGELIRMVPGENHALRIDSDVFRFAVAPDGDAVLYERASDHKDPLGKRQLKIYHASRREGHMIRTFDFPKEQVSELGPWGPGAVFVEVSVDTYSDKFVPDKTEKFTIDAFNPTKLIPVAAEEAP